MSRGSTLRVKHDRQQPIVLEHVHGRRAAGHIARIDGVSVVLDDRGRFTSHFASETREWLETGEFRRIVFNNHRPAERPGSTY